MSKAPEAYIVCKHLQCAQKLGNTWTGYVDSQEEYDEFIRDLAAFGISFKTLRTRSSLSEKGRLLLCTQRGDVVINEDVPFKVVETLKRCSIFQKPSQEEETSGLKATLTESTVPPCLKEGPCTAMMSVKQIERYPEFRVPHISQYSTKRGREAAIATTLARLRLALKKEAAGKPVLRQHRFYISMDVKGCHHHHVCNSICEEQPVNVNALQNKTELAQPNQTSAGMIGRCLTYYVKEVLVTNEPSPVITSEDCYATKQCISDHIQRALRKDGFSSLKPKGIARCVEELNEKVPMTSPLFFTYEQRTRRELQSDDEHQAVQLDCDVLAAVASECKAALLRCTHTDFMKNLMLKYCEVVLCMEAAYGGTDYALPVFLICFKTQSCHAVVGAFVVHFEMANCMEEMLDLFKASDSDSVSTKFWVIEHSRADIEALCCTFPRSHPLLCNFHREQAWRSEEASIVRNVSLVKKMLQQVAHSKNDEERKLAVEALEQSPHWQGNKKLQGFICQKWLLVSEMLAKMRRCAFRDDMDEDLETKSGKLQACLTEGGSHHDVRGLVRVLAQTFSPESEEQALQVSTSSLPSYPLFNVALPKFLHGKPSAVTKQIMEHLTRAANYRRLEIKPGKEEGTFFVQSTAQSSSFHEVNVNVPSCTCSFFVQTALPCRHLAAVFLLVEGWDFSRLPATYRNGPHMTAHEDTDSTSQETFSKASQMEVSIKAEPDDPDVTAREDADSMSQETVSRALQMEVSIKVEPDDPDMTAHENADCTLQEMISKASQMDICIQVEQNDPHMTAHEDADSTSWETISKASQMEVCVKVEPNEPHMTAHEGADCSSQEAISKTSEMEVYVKVEPNEPHVTAYEDAGFLLQETISEASQTEVSIKVEPDDPDMTAHEGADSTSWETIKKASQMEAYVKVEPNEPHMTAYEGAGFLLQETISEASQTEVCIKLEPNEPHLTAHEDADYASQETSSKASETDACVKVEWDLQPAELLVEACTVQPEQNLQQSLSDMKSQIGAQMEEIDSLLCYVRDNNVLQWVLDKFNQVGALVERHVPGCSAASIEKWTAEGRSNIKRKGATPAVSTKKKKDFS